MTPPAVLTLPPEDQAAARARAVLRQAHCITHADTLLDEAQLLVSELVTNAVRYGTPRSPWRSGDESTGLTVRVSDADPRLPTVDAAGDQDKSGRGVALVDLISDAWASTQHCPAKTSGSDLARLPRVLPTPEIAAAL